MGEGAGHDPESFDYWAVLRDQGEYFDPQILTESGVQVHEDYATDIITDLSLDWLESNDDDAPWCILIHHKAPPEDLNYEQPALWKYQRYMEDYLGCVASGDDNVGRVIDWLKEHEQSDDTMLLYSSDQGFFLGDHGWFDKRLMYDEALRMPLLISYPAKIPAGGEHADELFNLYHDPRYAPHREELKAML